MGKVESRDCRFCGTKFSTLKTQCPACRQMNVEVTAEAGKDGVISLDEEGEDDTRLTLLKSGPWDINLGNYYDDDGVRFTGMPEGTVALLGGKNGSGKSTLCMQSAKEIIESSNDKKKGVLCTEPGHVECYRRNVLYISAEEGTKAVRARAHRLGLSRVTRRHIKVVPIGVQVDLGPVMTRLKPRVLYVDSISKVAEDVAKQVEFCDTIRGWCEEMQMPAIILSHINKEGELAGLESLQHAVDSTHLFTIDTDRIHVLETLKNRNGEAGLKTLFAMTAKGLVEHVDDDESEDEEEDLDDEDEEEVDDE